MAVAVLAEPGGVRDAKGVSDSKCVLLVGEKRDYPHRAFVAGAPLSALAELRVSSSPVHLRETDSKRLISKMRFIPAAQLADGVERRKGHAHLGQKSRAATPATQLLDSLATLRYQRDSLGE